MLGGSGFALPRKVTLPAGAALGICRGGRLRLVMRRDNGRAPVAELISVIVTTYNREDALDAVLRSLAHQSDADFEVIVADDGSGPATSAAADRWKGK